MNTMASCGGRPVWPAPESKALGQVDRFLVPADAPDIIAYFLDHLFVGHSVRERLMRPLHRWTRGRLLFSRPARLGRGAATLSHAGDGVDSTNGMITALLEAHGEALFRGTSLGRRRHWRWIVERDYPTSHRQRVVVFLFGRGEDRPAAVVKLGRATTLNGAYRREHGALRLVRSRLPQLLKTSVPVPLACREVSGFEALLLTCLPGRSAYVEMYSRLAPRYSVARHLRQASVWLARFHGATRSPSRVFEPDGERSAVLPALAAQGTGTIDPSWYDTLCERCRRSPVPLAGSHGDFWARNLLLNANPFKTETGEALPGVVDWEHFREEAPPFEDLFHFPLTYGLNYPWSRYGRRPPAKAFRLTFLERNHVSREVRLYFDRYCGLVGIDAGLLEPLFRLYLLTRATSGSAEPADRSPKDRTLWLQCHQMLAQAGGSVFSG